MDGRRPTSSGCSSVRGPASRHPGRPAAAGIHLSAGGRLRAAADLRRAAAARLAAPAGPAAGRPLAGGTAVSGALHANDVAEAYRLAVVGDGRGAYNVAAEPVIDAVSIGEVLGSRVVPVPGPLARVGLTAAWQLRLVPAEPTLLDLALQLPLLDITRIRTELGWSLTVSSLDALLEVLEVLEGTVEGAGAQTPPLAPDSPAGRLHEGTTGVGERST
jgi:hypothetical protein